MVYSLVSGQIAQAEATAATVTSKLSAKASSWDVGGF
jgi:hypothetical protein